MGDYDGLTQEFQLAFVVCYIPPIALVICVAKVIVTLTDYYISTEADFIGPDCVANAIVTTISVLVYRRRYRKMHHLYTLPQMDVEAARERQPAPANLPENHVLLQALNETPLKEPQ